MRLQRIQLDPDVTIGRLTIDGSDWACWVCEDTQRAAGAAKVYGATAIPVGSYGVIITWSNRFQKQMPVLLAVPGFEGVRIHPGNTAADTDGCLLPGFDRLPKGVGRSVLAWQELFVRIQDAVRGGGPCSIEILDAPALA